MWSGIEVSSEIESSAGALQAVVRKDRHDGEVTAYSVHVSGRGRVRSVVLRVTGTDAFEEVFLTAPNFNDVRFAHPQQGCYQGLGFEHRDGLFGPQWMFSPPPMVFPVRKGDAWYGFGLGAPPGLNQYSGWSYCPGHDQEFSLRVNYEGYFDPPKEQIFSVLFFGKGRKKPSEVVLDYAEALRGLGWAARPARHPPDWWSDTFLFPWGEQCNLAKAKNAKPYFTGDAVTMYETQANQERWFNRLKDRGVPVGISCTSDKWQLERQRLVPDVGKYPDLRGFADSHHAEGRHVMAWWGLWRHDAADSEWCLRDASGAGLCLDPESEGYATQIRNGVEELVSPRGYDFDGFFIDFTAELVIQEGLRKSGSRWGVELLHHYLSLIHDAAKNAKKDALIMTHCAHPYFADVTDVFRLNDWSIKKPDLVEQGRYRHSIASACSDWLINTDNWFMYDINQWREYLRVAPELGIPATWYTTGIWGDGPDARYEELTDKDYVEWASIWSRYRKSKGLGKK